MKHRYLLLIAFHAFNGLLLISSVGMAGLGCFLAEATVRKRYTSAFVFLTAFATLLVSLVGCFSVVRENTDALIFYIALTVLLVAGMIAFGVILLIAATDQYVISGSEKDIEQVFSRYPSGGTWKKYVDKYQAKHNCCGIDSPADWVNDDAVGLVPSSCCDMFNDHACNEIFAYQESCKEVWLRNSRLVFRLSAAILWIGAIIGVACVVLAWSLRRRFVKAKQDGRKANEVEGFYSN